tara:strand:+ start:217 stop:726 length:510 start_codon:yes stop_codon:yes gene_type:complete
MKLKKKSLVLRSIIIAIILIANYSYTLSIDVKLKSSYEFKKIETQSLEKDFLLVVSESGIDSLRWEDIERFRFRKYESFNGVLKSVTYTGFFSLFYFLLETMYKEAPFSVPQFIGVFTLFSATGAISGYTYAKILDHGYSKFFFLDLKDKKKETKFAKTKVFFESIKKL